MRSAQHRLKGLIALVLVLMMAPFGVLVAPSDDGMVLKQFPSFYPAVVIDGIPPLICGDEAPCLISDRAHQRQGRAASEQWGWWFSYGPDRDGNGMDDRLQVIIAGEDESASTTSILAEDGRQSVAIVVDWAWHPGAAETSALQEVLRSHGWVGTEGGAWWQVLDSIDSIAFDKVPVSALLEIWSLEGVVVVEQQNVMYPTLDTAVPAVLARSGDIYVESAHEQGFLGSGVVIAVLDTGVDNEHRSLNDFDDEDDEPDLSADSYDDQKWVAGYDATSSTSQQDGSGDPDDAQGHGSHVAGIALGSGDSRRVNMGAAPGAYLVDVKVLTDLGGTNSQNSINGIQWVINNRDTDWGNNASSIGIQIASMSFGTVGNPANQGDTGDNGSSAESRLVNNASLNGVVMVAAIGNDGTRRVPSPASADRAITVAAVNNRDTQNRSDDTIASYSNYGPRDSDDDENAWDELKPDVAAPGSNIKSVSAATQQGLPGQSRTMADSDYENKDGTSMSTPLVSGVLALVLEANPTLDPQQVKDLVRNNSEVMGSPDMPGVSDIWDDHWGFGMINALCLVRAARGIQCDDIGGGGGVNPPPPSDNGSGMVVNISMPVNGSWMITEKMTRIKGHLDETFQGRTFEDVYVRITRDGEELLNWTKTGGGASSWLIDFKPDAIWGDGEVAWIEAKAKDDLGNWSESVFAHVRIGEHKISFTSPSGHDPLVGSTTFSGNWEGIEPTKIQYRVDAGDWLDGDSLTTVEYGSGTWAFDWDSTSVNDGTHRITVRLNNASSHTSDELRRSFNVDNEPPAPDLSFLGDVNVLQRGVPVSEALTLTHLLVEADIVNNGDAAAKQLKVRLDNEAQSQSIDVTISHLDPGQVKTVSFIWKPLEPGQLQMNVIIDPGSEQGEPDVTDNSYSFDFEVLDRPDAIDLTMLEGACLAEPTIPIPNKAFELICRIDNLGKRDAINVEISLLLLTEDGWTLYAEDGGLVIPGSSDSIGYHAHSFALMANEGPLMRYRIVLLSDDFNSSDNSRDFSLVIDEVEVLGEGVDLDLDDDSDEVPLGISGLEEGAHLLTERNGELHVRILTSELTMPGDNMLTSGFAGSADIIPAGGGLSYVVWTKKFTSSDGYTMTDIAFTTIDERGQSSMVQTLLPALKHNEGEYWGLSMASDGPLLVIAGYHRDISTGGTYQDLTNLFLLSTETPADSESWTLTRNVITAIDTAKHLSDPPAIGIGKEKIHILYQAKRDDITGIQRMGLFYSHGRLADSAWSFHVAVGDEASKPSLVIKEEDGEDLLIATWKEGAGLDAKLAHIINDGSWSVEVPSRMDAAGLSNVILIDVGEQVQVVHDLVDVYGDAISYGVFTSFNVGQSASLSSTLMDGRLVLGGASADGSHVIIVDNLGNYRITILADTDPGRDAVEEPSFWQRLIEPLPGDEEMKNKIILGIGVSLLVLLLLVSIVIRRAKHAVVSLPVTSDKVSKSSTVDIEILLDATDIEEDEELEVRMSELSEEDNEEAESSLQEELEDAAKDDEASQRLKRRMQRVKEAEYAEKGLPLPPVLEGLPLPPPPEMMNKEVTTDVEMALEAKEIPLIEGLSLPPPPGPMDAPAIPQFGDAPPPPMPGSAGLPTLEREARCEDCDVEFTVRDLMRKRVRCPICNADIIL